MARGEEENSWQDGAFLVSQGAPGEYKMRAFYSIVAFLRLKIISPDWLQDHGLVTYPLLALVCSFEK